jgi:hypothetical protein
MAWRSSKVSPGASNLDLAIRPLGLGEIIDRAVALTVRHFRPLFLWMVVLQAPAIALSRVQLAQTGELLANLGDSAAALEGLKSLSRTSLWVVALLLILQSIATAVCAAVVAPTLAPGPAPGPPRGARFAALGSAAVASLLLLVAATALAALPGLLVLARAKSAAAFALGLALFVGGVGLAWLLTTLRVLLAPIAAALEGRPHFAAVGRSFGLMRSTPGLRFVERPAVRASLVLLATFVIALAVSAVVGVPRGVAGRTGGGAAFLTAVLPLWAEIALGLFETAASAALQPFSLVAVAVLYFDRRARREGLDLERFAAEVEASP